MTDSSDVQNKTERNLSQNILKYFNVEQVSDSHDESSVWKTLIININSFTNASRVTTQRYTQYSDADDSTPAASVIDLTSGLFLWDLMSDVMIVVQYF